VLSTLEVMHVASEVDEVEVVEEEEMQAAVETPATAEAERRDLNDTMVTMTEKKDCWLN
jgi:hypothetical protein